jgi:uncharacterized protein YcfJ
MSKCPKCKSTEIDVLVSESLVTNCTVLGAQIGSIAGCALGVGAGGLGAFVGVNAGAVAGGWAGHAIGQAVAKAINPDWHYLCQKCGYSWKEADEP